MNPARHRTGKPVRARVSAERVELVLEGGRVVAGTAETDWDTGRVAYRLTGSRVAGTWTVVFVDPAEFPLRLIRVHYGEHRDGVKAQDRKDLPIVNGVEIIGSSYYQALDLIDRMSRTDAGGRRAHPTYTSELSPATAHRLALVSRAVATHFAARLDLEPLHRVAAAHEAIPLRDAALEEAAAIEDSIDTELANLRLHLTAQRDHYLSTAARFDRIATADSAAEPPPSTPAEVDIDTPATAAGDPGLAAAAAGMPRRGAGTAPAGPNPPETTSQSASGVETSTEAGPAL